MNSIEKSKIFIKYGAWIKMNDRLLAILDYLSDFNTEKSKCMTTPEERKKAERKSCRDLQDSSKWNSRFVRRFKSYRGNYKSQWG